MTKFCDVHPFCISKVGRAIAIKSKIVCVLPFCCGALNLACRNSMLFALL